MGNYTREEILQMVEEEDVEFIRLQFTDMFGAIKNIAVTTRELPRALANQCMINGEQIAGMDPEKGSDLYLRPVLDTFAILPWRPQQGKVARMICNLYWPDGTPYKNSPRYILERVAEEAEQEGYTCYIDPECEFFLFHTDDNGNPIIQAGWRFKNSALQSAGALSAISELTAGKRGISIKLHDPKAAIKQLADLQGWEPPKEAVPA